MNQLLRSKKSRTAALAVASSLLATGLAHANVITSTSNWQILQRLTGPDLTSNVGIGGTDLGHMVNHNGKTYFLFGDTFASEGTAGSGGPDWRNNVMAWTTDKTPANGLTFDGWLARPDGTAKQAIVPGSLPTTYIPTGAISVNDKIYAWYMHVSNWTTGWTLSHAGLASWREGDSQFTTVPNFRFQNPNGPVYSTDEGTQGPGNFGMVAASKRSPLENANDDHVYLWGTPGGREGGVKLARVAPAQIENLSAYQFFNGTVNGIPQWTNNEFDGDKIIANNVGEMSVMYNEALEAWTLMYVNGGNDRFEIRQSKTPWGQWSEPKTVLRPDQAPGGMYAPYMNPLYVDNGGKTLYFTMSLWDPYDVYLAKVDLNIDMQTRWAGGASNWANAAPWTYGTPTAADRASIDNHGIVQLNTTAAVRNLDVGTTAGAGGNLLIGSGAALTVHDGGVRLGVAEGGQGSLTMTGGSVNVVGGFNMFLVGDHGEGSATISGGTITARTFGIGLQPTSAGFLDLSGNAVITTTGDRFVMAMTRSTATGERPAASMTMTGGTINVNAGASGIPDAVIGFDGYADLQMSGGTFNVAGLFVSAVAGASGTMPRAEAVILHSGGTINASRMALSENGLSNYSLSDTGKINVRGKLTIGWRAGSEGTLHQTGGDVKVDVTNLAAGGVGLIVGESGRGTYTIDAGTLQVPRHLRVADLAGSIGRLNINGGAVTVGETLSLGMAGNAELTQSGGSLTVGTLLRVGTKGTLNHVAGSLSTPALQVDGGGKVLLSAGGNKLLAVNDLTVDVSGGVIDLADNHLLVRNGGSATLAAIEELVRTGHAGGSWTGAGIRSASAALDTLAALGVAQASSLENVPALFGTVDADDVLVRYTFRGDADLSGGVGFDDLLTLAQNYAPTDGGKTWREGDGNYDGLVDFDDLLALAQNYGKGEAPGAAQMELLSPSFSADWALARSLVPEPATALAMTLMPVLLRRRRM